MTTPPPYNPSNDTASEGQTYMVAPLVSTVMRKTFGWMAMCLLITALTAMGFVNSGLFYHIASSGAMWLLIIAELVLVFVLSARINKMSVATATIMLIVYSALNGVTLSFIFVVYSLGSIAKTFFITTGMFGVMALVGATTKRDLSKLGSILFMALIGLIIASLVNIFLRSSGLDWIISLIGVVLFTALTAYDVQRVKQLAAESDLYDDMQVGRLAVISALSLYLDFINLFLYLLRFFGRK
ncbi:Bax inhibitor-1/YccA family protein [uncultured Porphyromonas sp.]|uniref:Bax inhibitor-1/YccA family protein n=1 Tax=uncultured Porphyromonas sp. TaxID=159274 RepID=UPI002805409C|nr:Bax inhibitor-1/YccA family protein [uncultured Porphyromonas sp.]